MKLDLRRDHRKRSADQIQQCLTDEFQMFRILLHIFIRPGLGGIQLERCASGLLDDLLDEGLQSRSDIVANMSARMFGNRNAPRTY